MHLAGPREVCVCITYSREAWIEGPTGRGRGGRGRDSTRNESGLERERRIRRHDKRFHSLECVYARGEGIEARGEFFCVVSVLVCVGVRR